MLKVNEKCIERCCQALQSAKNLRLLRFVKEFHSLVFYLFAHLCLFLFSWKLLVYFPFEQLVFSVAQCTSLVQLGLILPAGQQSTILFGWTEEAVVNLLVKLVEQLPKLVALLVVLPTVPQAFCVRATAVLKKMMVPTRPCFAVQITHSLESECPPRLPWIHYQVLAADSSTHFSDLPHHLDE